MIGYLAIVEVGSQSSITSLLDDEERGKEVQRKELLVTWVPNEVLDRMDEEDRVGYKKVEERTGGSVPHVDGEEDDGASGAFARFVC